MSNIQIVDQFVETLLANPECTMKAVQLRLSATDYELKLLHSDPLKPYEKEWEGNHQPEKTGKYHMVTDGMRQPHSYQFSGQLIFPFESGQGGKETL